MLSPPAAAAAAAAQVIDGEGGLDGSRDGLLLLGLFTLVLVGSLATDLASETFDRVTAEVEAEAAARAARLEAGADDAGGVEEESGERE